MPGLIGWPELILIFAIIIFIFGATRIKDIAKAVGEGVREFKKATTENPANQSSSDRPKDEEAVREAARKMGIDIEGKSTTQLVDEMSAKVRESK